METESRGQQATDPRQSWGPGVKALQEAPHGRSPYPKPDGSHFLPEINAKQARSNTGLTMHPRSLFQRACQLVPPPPAEAQVSSLGATLGTGRQGWVPKAERSNLPEELVFPEVKESQRVRSQPVGYRGRKTPTPRSTPQAPTLLYLFIYLGKGPKAQAGNGPIPAGRAGGTRSHIVFPARLPHPGPATGA